VTPEDIQNFERQKIEVKLWEEFKLSDEYKERRFYKREGRAFFLYVASCIPVFLFPFTAFKLLVVDTLYGYGILALLGLIALFVGIFMLFLRELRAIYKEKSEMFNEFKQKRGYSAV